MRGSSPASSCSPAGANAHPAVQRHELRCRVAQEGGERVEVRAALGQHERETPCCQLGQDVVGDPARALWIGRDRPEDLLDVRVGRQGRGIEVGASLDDDPAHRAADIRLAAERMAHGPALHRDDRVMAVAPTRRRGQAGDVAARDLAQQRLD